MKREKQYWDSYYSVVHKEISEPSMFSNYVYDNYIEEQNKDGIVLKIADLGCGNCRDSKLFANRGNYITSIDGSAHIECVNPNINLIVGDVEDILTGNCLQTLLDVFYMRWFLHAMPYDKAKRVFHKSIQNLKNGGLICIEVRSLHDTELVNNSVYNECDQSYSTNHKRWLYNKDMIDLMAKSCDLETLELIEDSNFSNTDESNPLLIRFIGKKRVRPSYKLSSNYAKYKNIIPKVRKNTFTSYSNMDQFNKIVEEYNITYVAVAGTILGLHRHGGIIPWDNDIDVGFISSEWEKLFKIKDILGKNGLPLGCLSADNTHCHFGEIDCFLLKERGDYLVGMCKTYCHKDEYKTICKQPFGYTSIYAPICSKKSLSYRYGKKYFTEGDINDNFHYKDWSIKRFELNAHDRSYQTL